MGRIETSIEIRAPPEKIWEMLAFDRQPEWVDGLKNLTFTSEVHTPEDKYKVGTSAKTTMSGEGEVDFEITESLENEKMVFSMKGSRTFVISTLLLESEGRELNSHIGLTTNCHGGLLASSSTNCLLREWLEGRWRNRWRI